LFFNKEILHKTTIMSSNRSYAIYGDGGVTSATLIPSLNAIANQGKILQVYKDTNQFKTWQNIILQDTLSEFVPWTERPTTVNVNRSDPLSTTGVAFWKIQLNGITDMTKIALQLPLSLSFTTTSANNYQWSSMVQGEYALLDCITRLTVRIGNNSIVVGREEMSTTFGLKHQAVTKKKTPTKAALLAQFGACYSNGFLATAGVGSSSIDPASDWQNAYLGAQATGVVDKSFAFCLGDVVPFFDQADTYLPKGTPLEIQLEWAPPLSAFIGMAPSDNIRFNGVRWNGLAIQYNYHLLTQDSQNIFNVKWVSQPLLYNYLTSALYTFQGQPTMDVYTLPILNNIQRPTEITISVCSTNLTVTPISTIPVTSYPESTMPGVYFADLAVRAQGRDLIRWINPVPLVTTVPAGLNSSGFAVINSLINEATNHEHYGDYGTVSLQATSTLKNGSALCFCLSPSLFYKRGINSTDQGAINLDIQLRMMRMNGLNLTRDTVIRVVTKTPTQLTIDSDLNVVEVQWPAIISDNGAVLQRTINTN
jgi:hypothetical protein